MNTPSEKEQLIEKESIKEVLTFFISGELFGIWPDDLVEIVEEREYVPVPNSPDFLSGIINSHGSVITVIDFTKILDKENLALGAPRRIAVLSNEDFKMGLLIPADLHVSFYAGDNVELLSEKSVKFFRKYIVGEGEDEFKISILDSKSIYVYLRDYFKQRSLEAL